LRAAVEHGLSLRAGICQVSGMSARYDLSRPAGDRLVEFRVGGEPVVAERTYRVATNSFLAAGGDRYEAFVRGRKVGEDALVADCVLDHLRAAGTISPPAPGRLVAV
jgi:5'-nucleotidase/UDP-sugar diphosphatase